MRTSWGALLVLPLAATAGGGELRGRVSLEGAPAPGVRVEAIPFESSFEIARRDARREPPPEAIAQAVSGADGRFALALPDGAGLVRVRVFGDGVVPMAVERPVPPGADLELDELSLARAHALAGRVVDPTGRPVVGADVALRFGVRAFAFGGPLRPVAQTAVTDAAGRFRFETAAESGNALRVDALGLASVERDGVASGALAAPIALVAGRVIAGTAWLEDGETPAAGALVRFEGLSTSRWYEVGPDGRFRVEDVESAAGAVVVDAGERGSGRASVSAPGDPARPEPPVRVVLAAAAGLSGRVVDAASGEPVGGVALVARDGEGSLAALSGRDGEWAIPGLAPGEWQLAAEAGAFVPWERGGVTLRPGRTESLEVRLERGASLRGRVVDERGEPIAGALCRLQRAGAVGYEAMRDAAYGRGAQRSDADGRFELLRLPLGSGHSLVVEHDEYATRTLGGIELSPGPPAAPLTVVLSRGLSVEGVVLDRDRLPVAGVELRLVFQEVRVTLVRRAPARRESGADGRFAFLGLAPGRYALAVRRPGYADAFVEGIALSPDAAADPIEVVLRAGAAVRGVVRAAGGAPLAGFRVLAQAEGGRTSSFGIGPMSREPTGPDGAFVVEGLVAGEAYELSALGNGYAGGGTPVTVLAPAEGVELVARGDGRIRGAVLDEEGRPLVDFEVEYRPSPGSAGRISFGPDAGRPGLFTPVRIHSTSGQFELERVPAGTWAVVATAEGYQRGTASGVAVEEGRTTDRVEVRLAPGRAVRGRVLDATSGRPVPDATVEVRSAGNPARRYGFRPGGDPSQTRSDAEGRFELGGLAPGRHALFASHPDFRDASTSVEVGDADAEVELRMEGGSRLEGSVVAAGSPVPDAEVDLSVVGGRFSPILGGQSAISDAQGRFAFGHLTPGRYSLVANLQGRASAPVEVAVPSDGIVVEVVVPLDGGARIRGVVEGLPEGQLGRVRVSASSPGGYNAQASCGPDGRFELIGAPVGIVRVWAWIGDWNATRGTNAEVSVAEGQSEVEVALRFAEGFRLEGQVTRDGEPAAGVIVMTRHQESGASAQVTTDTGGRYALEGLAAGVHELRLYTAAVRSGVARTVEMSGDALLDVALPTARIAGIVRDAETSRPLAEVSVSVETAGGERIGAVASDSVGRFAIEALEPVAHRLRFARSGYETRIRDVTASASADVAVELRRADGIALEARDGVYGTPLRDLWVRVDDASGTRVFSGTVGLDGTGRGEIPALPAGSYRLRAGSTGYASSPALAIAAPSSGLTVALTPGGALEIGVGPETQALPRPRARLLQADGRVYAPSIVADEPDVELRAPRRRLDHLPPGRFVLVVEGGVTREVEIREGAVASVQLP